MWTASLVLLLAFLTVASIDGFYFHLYKYQLYLRPDCRREHALHTANAVLFPLTLAPVFLAQTTGAYLWLAVAASVVTFGIESWDVFTEKASREALGGLTPAEYWMHFSMSGLRWGYASLAFASLPAAAWSGAATWTWRVPAWPDVLSFLPWGVTIVAIPVAALHLLLATEGAPRRLGERLLGMGFVRSLVTA